MDKNKLKILGVNCSPRKVNSFDVLKRMEKTIIENDMEMEIITLQDHNIRHCIGNLKCLFKPPYECIIKNDDMPMLREKFEEADGYIFSVPVYIMTIPGILKDFIDRCTNWAHVYPFTGKYGVVVSSLYAPAHRAELYTMGLMRYWLTAMGVNISGELTITTFGGYKETKAMGFDEKIDELPGVKEKLNELSQQLAYDCKEKPRFECEAEDLYRWNRMQLTSKLVGGAENAAFEKNNWYGKKHWSL